MAHRSFTVTQPRPENADDDAPSFDLDGLDRDGEVWTEENWPCVPRCDLPPGVLADIAVGVWVKDGAIILDRDTVLRFIRAVLVPEQHARWDLLLRDPIRRVSLDRLGDVMMWLTEEYTTRPTGGSPS